MSFVEVEHQSDVMIRTFWAVPIRIKGVVLWSHTLARGLASSNYIIIRQAFDN
jgi:hypothetical protein